MGEALRKAEQQDEEKAERAARRAAAAAARAQRLAERHPDEPSAADPPTVELVLFSCVVQLCNSVVHVHVRSASHRLCGAHAVKVKSPN